MNPELLNFHAQVVKCSRPEELFGAIPGQAAEQLATLKVMYRRFAMIAHGDRYVRLDEKQLAHVAFTKLNTLHQHALDKIESQTYGSTLNAPKKSNTPSIMRSKRGVYTVTSGLAMGDTSNVYRGAFQDREPVILKMAKHHSFNDLLEVEATALTMLNAAAAGTVSYKQFIPTLVESFNVKAAPDNAIRRVNVLQPTTGFRPLTDIVANFPEGVDPRHFVWIFKRLLSTLSFAHGQGIIHGAVLPTHVLVHPVTHAIQLIDWCFAVNKDTRIIAMSRGYASWYPPEVNARRPANASTDIYMAARCMAYILGADFGEWPSKTLVHAKFRRFLDACGIQNQVRRPPSAWELYKEVGTLSDEIFGPRRYLELQLT